MVVDREFQKISLVLASVLRARHPRPRVRTENLILFDYVTESPNVNGNDRAALLPVVPENSIR
jgi:hypothetical protein